MPLGKKRGYREKMKKKAVKKAQLRCRVSCQKLNCQALVGYFDPEDLPKEIQCPKCGLKHQFGFLRAYYFEEEEPR